MAINYWNQLEEDLQTLLVAHDITELAMLLFHRGWATIDDLADLFYSPNAEEFIQAATQQFQILRRPGMQFLRRILINFGQDVIREHEDRQRQ